MSSMINIIKQNSSFVRPQYFFINGFHDIPHAKLYYMFLCFAYVVAVCGNSIVMFIIFTQRHLHIPKYIGILNLAVADLGESSALIPNLIKTFLFDSQYITYEACLANMFFVFFFIALQSMTLVVLACDRFVAICLPLRYHTLLTNTSMSVMITGMWLVNVVIVGTTTVLITRLSYCKTIVIDSYFCDHGPLYRMACNDNSANSIMAKVNTVLVLHVPFVFIVLSYVCILLALFRITSWEGRVKALKTCISHLLIVALFFLPFISTYIAAVTFSLHPNARIICLSLASAIPPMLNPVIYVLNTEEIRGFLKKKVKQNTSKISNLHAL
ncbi:olfactory receptor 1-like [Salvelinus namaycush]|uniref:Olfactory receptor 1-like n=1 Tax=Salvelinus namaycush TaxID=8040 RepID=A0A8U0P4N5_SALNM|nr:olfactory receptor 1-like [Salvelinus namaycush]